jgi:phage gpG-like protein
MHLGVDFSGGDDFRNGMSRTAKKMPDANYRGVVRTCSLIETRAKTFHLAGRWRKTLGSSAKDALYPRTHRLQQSVKTKPPERRGTTTVGRVGSPVVYAAIHEFGGIIRPKNAKFLVFQLAGKWIHATKVTIPARRWLSKSVEDVKGQIEAIFGREVELILE